MPRSESIFSAEVSQVRPRTSFPGSQSELTIAFWPSERIWRLSSSVSTSIIGLVNWCGPSLSSRGNRLSLAMQIRRNPIEWRANSAFCLSSSALRQAACGPPPPLPARRRHPRASDGKQGFPASLWRRGRSYRGWQPPRRPTPLASDTCWGLAPVRAVRTLCCWAVTADAMFRRWSLPGRGWTAIPLPACQQRFGSVKIGPCLGEGGSSSALSSAFASAISSVGFAGLEIARFAWASATRALADQPGLRKFGFRLLDLRVHWGPA